MMKRLKELPKNIREKIWVNPETGCWEWIGSLTAPNGYAQIGINGDKIVVHNLVYELLIGKMDDGLEPDHICLIKRCVNPEHIEPVTHSENVKRAQSLLPKKTHCPSGHEYVGDNLYVNPNTEFKHCRKCQSERNDARALKQRGYIGRRIITHCPSGHEYNKENTHIRSTGGKVCRICNRDRARAKRRAL